MSTAERLVVIGDAYDVDEQQLLYREYHFYSEDLLDHKVIYKNPEGQELAVKTLNYRSGLSTPSFIQKSFIYPQSLSVSMQDKQLFFEYISVDDQLEKKQLKAKQPLVIDAGFDNYIRMNWDDLIVGNAVDFYFPAVARLSLFKLRLKGQECSYASDDDQCFVINSANWFISLVLAPIELGYDKKTQKLSRFRGLANLTDEAGKGLEVDIKYNYQLSCEIDTPCTNVALVN
jgi:hypothetical protein